MGEFLTHPLLKTLPELPSISEAKVPLGLLGVVP